MITVMLVEDHASYRQALEAVMTLEPDLSVVAHVERGDEAGAAAESHRPAVAVVDLDLPHVSGVDALVEIRRRSPETACLVLSALNDDVELGRSIEAGAAAILHKSVDVTDLLAAIRAVAGGASLLSTPETSRRLQALATAREQQWHARALHERLSARELEVLGYLTRGHSGQEIARALGISPDTVQTHIRNLLAKLGVGSRLEAVAKALRLGLVSPPS